MSGVQASGPDPADLAKLKGTSRTVAELLEMFEAPVRDPAVILVIRTALTGVGLTTVPSFDTAYQHELIQFVSESEQGTAGPADEETESPVPGAKATRVEVLAAANRGLTSVLPGTSLKDATTLMMSRRLAQLPVMNDESDLRGVVTWHSIWAMRARGEDGTVVEDAMEREDYPAVLPSQKLLTAMEAVAEHGYVLVHAADGRFTGVITHADLIEHFGTFAAPFFAIGEIERRLRTGLERKFDDADFLPGKPLAKFTLGSYWHFLEKDQNWQKLGWTVSKDTFLGLLNRVTSIRNEVMHFDPALMTVQKQQTLDEFAGLMRNLVR